MARGLPFWDFATQHRRHCDRHFHTSVGVVQKGQCPHLPPTSALSGPVSYLNELCTIWMQWPVQGGEKMLQILWFQRHVVEEKALASKRSVLEESASWI